MFSSTKHPHVEANQPPLIVGILVLPHTANEGLDSLHQGHNPLAHPYLGTFLLALILSSRIVTNSPRLAFRQAWAVELMPVVPSTCTEARELPLYKPPFV